MQTDDARTHKQYRVSNWSNISRGNRCQRDEQACIWRIRFCSRKMLFSRRERPWMFIVCSLFTAASFSLVSLNCTWPAGKKNRWHGNETEKLTDRTKNSPNGAVPSRRRYRNKSKTTNDLSLKPKRIPETNKKRSKVRNPRNRTLDLDSTSEMRGWRTAWKRRNKRSKSSR